MVLEAGTTVNPITQMSHLCLTTSLIIVVFETDEDYIIISLDNMADAVKCTVIFFCWW